MEELNNTRIEDAGEKFEGARKDAASPIFNQPFKLGKNDSKITKKRYGLHRILEKTFITELKLKSMHYFLCLCMKVYAISL
ncbi:hypothetical protein NLX66_020955 (plasmid) [Acinetobacter baumannii]|nr:hypothetical protein [Acinetobacter baumannii]MDT1781269.1 hypothetical protein [Acinetobacter baumannii]